VLIRDLGEFGVIARIERKARRVPSAGVVIGIGDDAAVLRPRSGEDVVVTTDALVENVHFRWSTQTPRNVGRRALVVNLSDLAAMGARPLGATWALAAPPELPVATLDGLVAGLLREASTWSCPLVGGNVTAARETSLTLSVVGAVARGRALTRTGARAGHRIWVTGTLGGAALERTRAERGRGRVGRVPVPRLAAGRALARVKGLGGCIDVSDGLEVDLEHVLGPAGLAAEIDPACLPLPRGFRAACRRMRLDPEELARTGGEDYELLFTLPSRGPTAAQLSRRLGVPVSQIGVVERRSPKRHPRKAGGRAARPREGNPRGSRAQSRGWTHF
jgi:thiamine-monophosphate kinase